MTARLSGPAVMAPYSPSGIARTFLFPTPYDAETVPISVSTTQLPRLKTGKPAPRARSSSAKVSMFWVDRPKRLRVVTTRVSPSMSVSSARFYSGRDARAAETTWLR